MRSASSFLAHYNLAKLSTGVSQLALLLFRSTYMFLFRYILCHYPHVIAIQINVIMSSNIHVTVCLINFRTLMHLRVLSKCRCRHASQVGNIASIQACTELAHMSIGTHQAETLFHLGQLPILLTMLVRLKLMMTMTGSSASLATTLRTAQFVQ